MTLFVKCLDAMVIVMLLVMETSGRGLGAAARQFSHRQGIRYSGALVLYYSMQGVLLFNVWCCSIQCSRSWCKVH